MVHEQKTEDRKENVKLEWQRPLVQSLHPQHFVVGLFVSLRKASDVRSNIANVGTPNHVAIF